MTAACPACGAPLPDLALEIRGVAIVLTSADDERTGLLAWARLRVGPFQIASLSIRLNSAGDIVVKHAAQKDRRGMLHRITTVLDPDLDRRIRATVIAAYIEERGRTGRRVS